VIVYDVMGFNELSTPTGEAAKPPIPPATADAVADDGACAERVSGDGHF
jgi:hypothetical protein